MSFIVKVVLIQVKKLIIKTYETVDFYQHRLTYIFCILLWNLALRLSCVTFEVTLEKKALKCFSINIFIKEKSLKDCKK